MKDLFFNKATAAFVVLAAATTISFLLSRSPGAGRGMADSIIIVVLAFAKVAIVIDYFMELRHAPWPMRGAALAWCVTVCAGVLAFYPLGLFAG